MLDPRLPALVKEMQNRIPDSASQGVFDGGTDSLEICSVDHSNVSGKHGLRDCVETIAIDRCLLIESCVFGIDRDLGC
jgi:hypothetical protein